MPRFACWHRPALLVLAAWLPARPLGAQAADRSLEYEVKAAYLFNFARYVEWPGQAFASPTEPLHVCVLGNDQLAGALDRTVAGRAAGGRPVIAEVKRSAAEARYCPLVFVALREWERFPGVIEQLRGHGVLTVGETAAFAQAGGIIAFTIEDGRVRFVVNQAARDRAGFRISSHMLSLASRLITETRDPPPPT